MGKNKRSSKGNQSGHDGLVFSTDTAWKQEVSSDHEQEAVDATKQTLYVSLNRKQRAG